MDLKTAACGCPEVPDDEWDLAEREWDTTLYYTKRLLMLFHIPVLKTRQIAKVHRELADKGFTELQPTQVMIKDGLFAGAVMVAVTESEITASPVLRTLAGSTVVTKIVRGSKKDAKSAVSELLSYVRSMRGAHPKAVYFWRFDCDRCREPGQENAVIIAEL